MPKRARRRIHDRRRSRAGQAVTLRDAKWSDWPAIVALNDASVEHTSPMDEDRLALYAAQACYLRVIVEHGEYVVRKHMRVTMSCDHRVVDGAIGAEFLRTLRRMIENPLMLVY